MSHGNKDRSKDKYQSKDQYRDDSYDKIRSRSKEKDYLYDEDDIFDSEIKKVYKILQTMSQEKEMVIGFMLAFSDNPAKILDSIHSLADVDHLIAERNEYGKHQKAENLTKEPHDSINNTSSQKIVDMDLTQDPVDTKFVEGKVDNYYTETPITGNSDSEEEVQIQNIGEGNITVDLHDELDLWQPEQIPHALIRLTEGQILEEFILEEIEFQGIDICKIFTR